jgi:MFS transporter, FHS family, glucose/mannose:H+ symporter
MRVAPAATTVFASLMFLHVTFFVTGIATTALGPLLPQLIARWSIDDLRAGHLFTFQFSGSFLGVLLSGLLLPRLGFGPVLALGYLLMAIGVGGLSVASWPAALAAVSCMGLGLGLTVPATNLLVAESRPQKRASALSTLNLAWSVGAVAIPILVTLGGVADGSVLLEATSVAAVAICAAFFWRRSELGEPLRMNPPAPESAKPFPSSSPLVIAALMFFFYVGTETSVGGWIASYAHRLDGVARLSAILAPSFFWGGILLGRALAPVAFRYLRESIVGRSGLVLASGGVLLAFFAAGLSAVMTGAFIAGLGLAPIFPIVVANFSSRFGAAARRLGAATFAMAALGGAILPGMVGYVSSWTGSLRNGLLVALAGAVILLLLFASEQGGVAKHTRSSTAR